MSHDEALKALLEEIDVQTEVYAEYSDENLIVAMKFACSCILRDMREVKKNGPV